MSVEELVTIVDNAYGDPSSEVAAALCWLVHKHYDEEGRPEEQVAELFTALWRVKERLERVLAAVDQTGRDAYRT